MTELVSLLWAIKWPIAVGVFTLVVCANWADWLIRSGR